MLFRGQIIRLFLGKSSKKIFIGKRVKLKYKSNILCGNNLVINDYVEIRAENNKSVVIGDSVVIGKYSIIKCTGRYKHSVPHITIGDNFACGDFCFFGCAGGVTIGDNVIMGQNVRFHAQNHNFDNINIPIREQGTNEKGIVIGSDCWIGAGSVFLDGVVVGGGCVIGANTVINKNIEPYSIVVGNPCRVIKNRKK